MAQAAMDRLFGAANPGGQDVGSRFGPDGPGSMPIPERPVVGPAGEAPAAADLSEEDRSKDAFFVALGEVAEAMKAKHGAEFAMGALVLAARFIAEGRSLVKPNSGSSGG